MRKNQQHLFSQIPTASVPRSAFDRSHGYKTTFNSGFLVPFYVDEVLPGDTFNLSVDLFARLATPIVPFMDNLHLDTFFFFVPNRLVWDNWQKFMGEQENPGDSIDFLVPEVEGTNVQNQTLWDYFGLPTNVANKLKVNSLYFRAYNLIWNEWFRDENLQDSVPVPKNDGPDKLSDFNLLRRGKRHDYFTSALPWPQKGSAGGIEINLGTTAPINLNVTQKTEIPFTVKSIGEARYYSYDSESSSKTKRFVPTNTQWNPQFGVDQSGYMDRITSNALGSSSGGADSSASTQVNLVLPRDMVTATGTADLTAASAISINDLRTAFQVQKLLERDARGGTRYTELLRSHFGVISPDARLQRPEYLGGSSTYIAIKPVEQTSASNDTTPQGNLAAYGVVGDSFHGFTKSFVEHGMIIGLVMVRADLTYQQGLNRMFSRRDRYDYYFPALAHLGEQEVLNKEIYAQGTAEDDKVFGYQERYAEYRYYPGQITGKFRSTDPQPLDQWHLAQKFGALPKLNSDFIQETPPVDRVVAVTDEPQFLFDSHIKLRCVRPMPVYSVPGFVDHF